MSIPQARSLSMIAGIAVLLSLVFGFGRSVQRSHAHDTEFFLQPNEAQAFFASSPMMSCMHFEDWPFPQLPCDWSSMSSDGWSESRSVTVESAHPFVQQSNSAPSFVDPVVNITNDWGTTTVDVWSSGPSSVSVSTRTSVTSGW